MKARFRANIFSKKMAALVPAGVVLAGSLFLFRAEVRAEIQTAIGNDVSGSEVISIVLEPFEDEGNKWMAAPYPKLGETYARTAVVPGTPRDLVRPWHKEKPDKDGKPKVMGVAFSFVFPSINNKVIVTPPSQNPAPKDCGNQSPKDPGFNVYCLEKETQRIDENGERIKQISYGLEIPGEAKQLSVWVLGRGNEYELEGWVEDWRGDTHIYQFGSVDFIGWRPLTVNIPENVPQEVDSFPQTKTLIFRKFVIRSRPDTSGEPVVLFLDDLKVLTDVFEVNFDGVNISFPEEEFDVTYAIGKNDDGTPKTKTKKVKVRDQVYKERMKHLVEFYQKRAERQ